MKKRRKQKKGLAILLTATMVAGLMPGTGVVKVSAAQDDVQTTLDISKGDITITDTTVSGYGSDGNAVTTIDEDGYIIKGTTTDHTVTVSGTQNITLDGVNIDVSSRDTAAFKIADDNTGDVTITLADGSKNILKSGENCAGLQKNGAYSESLGTLTIQGGDAGTGTLTATGGVYGAGIGGGRDSQNNDGYTCANVTISGGTVTATSSDGAGAGIGGGGIRYGGNDDDRGAAANISP